jgi:hypothetical protein
MPDRDRVGVGAVKHVDRLGHICGMDLFAAFGRNFSMAALRGTTTSAPAMGPSIAQRLFRVAVARRPIPAT